MFDTTTKANVSAERGSILLHGQRVQEPSNRALLYGLYGLVQTKVMQSYAEFKFVKMFIKKKKKME